MTTSPAPWAPPAWRVRILVCVMGLAVAVLSATGVVIWWRKRRARRQIEARRSSRRLVGYAE